MTKLSVNINKIALIRNSRGANFPNIVTVATNCEEFGADGITIHPRPDQRHVRYDDIAPLKAIIKTELNIEGNPTHKFIQEVLLHVPDQVTLVPDAPEALTSDTGWNTIENRSFLSDCILGFQEKGIRVSLFVEPIEKMIVGAKECGADRIEFYTGPYADQFKNNRTDAVMPYTLAAKVANNIGIGINAGHDLNLDNLSYFKNNVSKVEEVSIGHALVIDALYYGLKNTIQMYKKQLS